MDNITYSDGDIREYKDRKELVGEIKSMYHIDLKDKYLGVNIEDEVDLLNYLHKFVDMNIVKLNNQVVVKTHSFKKNLPDKIKRILKRKGQEMDE